MIPPPVFTTQEEVDAYADAQKDIYGGGAAGIARGLGIVDFLGGVPWLAKTEYSQQALDSMLAQQERLDPEEYKRAQKEGRMTWIERQRATSLGLLGDKKSREKINKRINVSESKTYDEAIEEFLKTFGYERNERSKIAEDVSFWTTVGVDLAFLAKVVIQNAPKGYRAVRDALKNIGKNMDEADQAVMKTQMELGLPETPVQMQMDLPTPKETTPFPTTVEELGPIQKDMFETTKPFNIEEPLYRWNRGPDSIKSGPRYDFVSTSMSPRYALGILTPDDVGGISAFKEVPVISAANPKTTLGDGGQLLALQLDPRKIKLGEVFDPLGNPEHLNRFYHWLRKNAYTHGQPYTNFKTVGGIDYNQPSVPKNFAEEFFHVAEDNWAIMESNFVRPFLEEKKFKAFISTEKGERSLMVFNEYADDVLLPQGKNLAEMREAGEALNVKGYKNGGLVQNSVDYALEQWS